MPGIANRTAWLAAALLPLLCGCQLIAPQPVVVQLPPEPEPLRVVPPVPVEPERRDELAELMAYFVRAGSLPAAQLQSEIALMEDRLRSDTGAATRLCLAYLLSLVADKPQYHQRSQQLLAEIQQELYTPVGYKDLAKFLVHSQRRDIAQRNSLQAERRQRRQLQQQLDALKDIERKIIERKPMPINGPEEVEP